MRKKLGRAAVRQCEEGKRANAREETGPGRRPKNVSYGHRPEEAPPKRKPDASSLRWGSEGSSTRRRLEQPSKRARPVRRMPPVIIDNPQVLALLAVCGPPPIGLRHRAMIVLMYRAGLRIGEVLALHPRDVGLEKGEIRVLRGKGDRFRIAGIDAGGVEVVRTWLIARSRMTTSRGTALPSDAPLICTREGTPVADAYVRRLMRRLGKRAGIDRRVHAHGLRHTHAAQLRAEGVDIGIISKQLGHRSILTTIRYLDHIAPVQVVRAMRERVWESSVEE
ncbi:MAG: phage integrase family protein [Phycisphaeraceae bacterium]|nr:phage integrase family protein [Phycisphaeraceae bacterium]